MRPLLLITALAVCSGGVSAQDLAVGARFGTAGPAAEVATTVGRGNRVRFGGAYWRLSRTSAGFDARSRSEAASGMVWLLWDRAVAPGLFVTAGAGATLARGTHELDPRGPLHIGGSVLTLVELGQVTFRAAFPERPTPILGLSYRLPLTGAVALAADAQASYPGRPTVRVEAEGRVAPAAAWQHAIEESLRGFRWMPLVSMGVEVSIGARR